MENKWIFISVRRPLVLDDVVWRLRRAGHYDDFIKKGAKVYSETPGFVRERKAFLMQLNDPSFSNMRSSIQQEIKSIANKYGIYKF